MHADELRYDQYGSVPDAQIVKGKVSFRHKGAHLTCDSAYFYESSNSFDAFGHVRLRQGDTLTLVSDYAYYDGNDQMAYARRNVVLTHRGSKLYTDSLVYDRLYDMGWFVEGGKLVDKKNVLTSDWGEYHADTRQAVFNYSVNLKNPKFLLTTDTLHYDTKTGMAHMVGPSKITSKESVINTTDGYYDTNKERAELYGRSTVVDEEKNITADSLYYDEKKGVSEGYRNVIYVDKANRNKMTCNRFVYNEKTGNGYATDNPVMIDYSQKDTLWMHSDTIRIETFHIDTDSAYRKVHCYNKVRAYRVDVQAVCDSLVYNSLDSCLTMYRDPITWYGERQLLGERIEVFMKDSTVDRGRVMGQALSVERTYGDDNFNQIQSHRMYAFFRDGEVYRSDAGGNVLTIFYPVEEKDTTLLAQNYLETDTMTMFMEKRQMQRIWASKHTGTWYPITQIPPSKKFLPQFAWFDYIRPLNKDDIYEWRGKKSGSELKILPRREAPLQRLSNGKTEKEQPLNGKTEKEHASDSKAEKELPLNGKTEKEQSSDGKTEKEQPSDVNTEQKPSDAGKEATPQPLPQTEKSAP